MGFKFEGGRKVEYLDRTMFLAPRRCAPGRTNDGVLPLLGKLADLLGVELITFVGLISDDVGVGQYVTVCVTVDTLTFGPFGADEGKEELLHF